ncbi:MAG: YHS domain-containing protein [Armatimonadetes bacterium]|nr:YHS domain-containing protein [Armatimonadota bacterium]
MKYRLAWLAAGTAILMLCACKEQQPVSTTQAGERANTMVPQPPAPGDTAATPAGEPKPGEAAAPAAGAPVNKLCPVSGDPIDPKVTTELEGKTYAFCCAGCIDKFKAEPAKYLAQLKDFEAKAAAGQPVGGGMHDEAGEKGEKGEKGH